MKTQRILQIGIFLLFASGATVYFYQRNAPPLEPVKIYKVTEFKKSPDAEGVLSEEPPVDGIQVEFDDIHAGHLHQPDPLHPEPVPAYKRAEEKKTDPPEVPSPELTDLILPPPDMPVETSEDIARGITEKFDDLYVWFEENYPDIVAISYMSQEEFFETYSTPESQRAIKERAQQAIPELFGQLRPIFLEVPTPLAGEVLGLAREHFIEKWGTETADLITAELRAHLGL